MPTSSPSAAAPTSPPSPPGLLLPGGVLDEREDCLFLDIYAPADSFDSQGKAIANANLPVIVWIYGGAYMFGSKYPNPNFPLYSGESILRATGYKAIFVTGNYRLGAFGWLAGSHMESEETAAPNAGLYDQALLLSWIRDNIAKVGGNSSRVSVWGESAGASSILHHLVRQNGGDSYEPGFQTFLAQSPAYEWQWDDSPGGVLDRAVLSFQNFSGCSPTQFDLGCLRNQEEGVLALANRNFSSLAYAKTHEFSVGPAVDRLWITKLPTLLLHEGSYFKGITAAIISHVGDEPFSFTPPIGNDSAQFSSYLSTFFPGPTFSDIRGSIAAQTSYQASHYSPPFVLYGNAWRKALSAVIRDSSFVCNARLLHDAFTPVASVYAMEYDFPFEAYSFHAGDLAPLFMNDADDAFAMVSANWPTRIPMPTTSLRSLMTDLATGVAPAVQSFFGAFGVAGTPTQSGVANVPAWPTASTSGSNLAGVMQVSCHRELLHPLKCTPRFAVTTDDQGPSDVCGFWIAVASQVSSLANNPTATSTGAQPVMMVTEMPSAEAVRERERLDL
jgi:carboxylesterase type B